jgi:hypothetical protein
MRRAALEPTLRLTTDGYWICFGFATFLMMISLRLPEPGFGALFFLEVLGLLIGEGYCSPRLVPQQ